MTSTTRRRIFTGAAAAAASLLACAAPAAAIVGGQPATQPYPYAAQLEVDDEFICGGSLVRPDWVLTAAHCVEDEDGDVYEPARLRANLGRARLSGTDGSEHAIAQVVQHEGFSGGSNDVALLRLAQASSLAPIRVAGASDRAAWAPGVQATVAGWGATVSGGGPSDQLREAQVTIQSDSSCHTSTNMIYGYDPQSMLCAGEAFGGRDACQGDSGGPLTAPGGEARPILVGVVSGGVGCALPASYGIYARIGGDTLSAWLAKRLPAPPSGSQPPPPAAAAPALAVVGKLSRRRGRVRVRLRASEPLTHLRVRVKRRGRLIAKGRAERLEGTRTLRLKARRRLRRKRHWVNVRALDAAGTEHRYRLRARRR